MGWRPLPQNPPPNPFDALFAQLVRGMDDCWDVTRRMAARPGLWAGTSAAWFGSAIVFTEPGLMVGGVTTLAAACMLWSRQESEQDDGDFRAMLDAYQDRVDAIHEQTDADVAAHLAKTRARHAKQHADWDAKLRAAEGLPPVEQHGTPILPEGFQLVRLPGVVSPNEARAAREQLQPIRREYVDADGDVTVVRGFAPVRPAHDDARAMIAEGIRAAQKYAIERHAEAAAEFVVEQLRLAQAREDYRALVEQRGPVGVVVPAAGADAALSIRKQQRAESAPERCAHYSPDDQRCSAPAGHQLMESSRDGHYYRPDPPSRKRRRLR